LLVEKGVERNLVFDDLAKDRRRRAPHSKPRRRLLSGAFRGRPTPLA
jgi:hypothetical protein